ncbi:MAG TPA: hypothetical protein VF145_13840 [Chitinophagaceae bacterium]
MSQNNINLAGEFYAMHALFRRGFVAALTLGNTKGVDILLYNPANEKQFKVEVKTSSTRKNEPNFGGENISWIMNKKHELMSLENLIYCFVYIPVNNLDQPRIFFVPSSEVARYVFWQHDHWLRNVPHKREVKDTPMRTYRILKNDFEKWENNFELFV